MCLSVKQIIMEIMKIHYKGDNGPVDEAIRKLFEVAGGIRRPEIVREMIIASLKAGQEDDGGADLKLMSASAKEMRFTAKAFRPYSHRQEGNGLRLGPNPAGREGL